jgi:hypothetical protein
VGIVRRLVKGLRLTAGEYDGNLDLLGGGNTPTLVTISGGIAAISGAGLYRLETEAAAAIDTLDRLTNVLDSDVVYLRIANNARQVIIAHGTWIKLETAENLLLANTLSSIYLRNHGSGVMVEERRSIHP